MEVLTITQLCQKLSLTRQSIYALRKKGLPSVVCGGVVRFDWEKVWEWLNAQSANPTQEIEEDPVK